MKAMNEAEKTTGRSTLHIKQFESKLIRGLKVRAAMNGRTMREELETIIRQALEMEAKRNGR